MPMIRAMRMLNAIEAGTLTGAQLQTLLTGDPGRLAELNQLLQLRGQVRRLAASSTAMAAVIASSTAMAAVAASSTAMAAVAASSTAMAAVAASKAALLACWNSETALTALRGSAAALTALMASQYKSTVGNGNAPSSLTITMLAGKTILLQSCNANSSDTNTLATKYQNGSAVANHVYSTAATNSTQMVAFVDIKHATYVNNYGWYGDVVKVD